MSLLWPRHSNPRARRALRNALHEIRRALGPNVIVRAGDDLVGVDAERLTCDLFDVERGSWPPDASPPPDAFEGFHVDEAAPFSHWVERERDRLRALVARGAHLAHARASATNTSTPRATTTSPHPGPHHHTAHALYVRGHYLFLRSAHGGSTDDLHRAREHFERALQEEPQYAPAIAGMANFFAVAARRELLLPFGEVFAQAIALSHQAQSLDATLAAPHVHFAVKAWFLDDQLDRAGEQFAAAVACEPSYAEGRRFYGAWLSLMRRDAEALVQMEEAARLEPDIPHVLSSLAATQLALHREAEAEQTLRQVLALDARHGPARERLVRLFERQGRLADAVTLRQTSPNQAEADAFRRGWEADGVAGYERVRRERLEEKAALLEARLLEQGGHPGTRTPRRAGDVFSPPEVQLVSLYAELGDWKRVRSRELAAVAARPALATWIAALPELRFRSDR